MNSISIAGNVGKDAVTRTTQGGEKVTSFSVAVSETKDKTTWFNCSFWGDRGEKVAPYITKGSKLAATGRVSAREHEGKAYLEVSVHHVTLMGSKADREGETPKTGIQGPQPQYGSGVEDDEIPF